MLPKPEKGKKLNNNFLSDSEITKESDEVVAAKKVKSKRRIILISLIGTAGLSLIFWTVKGVQSFISSPHPINFSFNFKLPQFNFKTNTETKTKTSTSILSSDLDKFLSDQKLSAVIFKNNDLTNPIYQYNFSNSNISEFISELSKTKSTETSSIVSGLPEGLLFQEKLDANLYGLTIKLPNQSLTFIVQDTNKSENFSQNISSFINQTYWYSVSQN